jgi:hypothetical protein
MRELELKLSQQIIALEKRVEDQDVEISSLTKSNQVATC